MQNHPTAPDDEISLLDLWQTLARRKWAAFLDNAFQVRK